MNDQCHELLELARGGQDRLLRGRVAACSAELETRKSRPEGNEPYGRALLYRAELGEVMLALWRPGARSAPHDHGQARGVVIVLAGSFTETSYVFDGHALRASAERELAPGALLRTQTGAIHDLEVVGEGLTLHLYLPSIHAMRVYDRDARATLQVTGECGAWLPEQTELILERQLWASTAPRSEQ